MATPYTWSLQSGTIPPGLTPTLSEIDLDIDLAGTPTTQGIYNFTLRITNDVSGIFFDKAYTLAVYLVPSFVTTSPLTDGETGVAYNEAILIQDGLGPYTWSLLSGTLPPGLALNTAATGLSSAITGTPTASGVYNFTIRVVDANNQTVDLVCQLTIIAAPIFVTTSPLPDADQGVAYNESIVAQDGVGPYTWSLLSGLLPPGLSLDTGETDLDTTISGVPTTSGVYNFTIRLVDNNGFIRDLPCQLTVNAAPALLISTSTLPPVVIGDSYNEPIVATGGVGPYTWALLSGSLPPGLSLDTGQTDLDTDITGTATQTGLFQFTVRITDTFTGLHYDRTFTIEVVPVVTLRTRFIDVGNIGSSYIGRILALGGIGPYTWEHVSGTLPTGLTFDDAETDDDTEITGVPTESGVFPITVRVTDSTLDQSELEIQLRVNPQVSIFTDPNLDDARVGVAYQKTIEIDHGVGPFNWSVISGALPAGFTLTPHPSGRLVQLIGQPTLTGIYQFTIRVTDGDNSNFDDKQFTLAVTSRGARRRSNVQDNSSLATPTYLDQNAFDCARYDNFYSDFTRINKDPIEFAERRPAVLAIALEYRISSFPYTPDETEQSEEFGSNCGFLLSRGSDWTNGVIVAPKLGTGNASGVQAWALLPDQNFAGDTVSILQSPIFDFSGLSSSGFALNFDLWLSCGSDEGLKLQVSTDGGETWSDVTTSEPYNVVSDLLQDRFGGAADGWGDTTYGGVAVTPVSVPIAPWEGVADVRFRWCFASQKDGSDYGPVIDSIEVS